MAQSRLEKRIENQIDELHSLAVHGDTPPIFILEGYSRESKEWKISGRILPNSEIFRQGSFRIQITLPAAYPFNPPKITFETPIHHPNVTKDGVFYHELLQKTMRWTITTTLVDTIRTLVKTIDEPDASSFINQEIAKEFLENREQFNRTALDMIQRHALPRIDNSS